MRAVVQRVSRARVTVRGEVTGEIGQGLLVFLGVGLHDDQFGADYLVKKIAGLRIFDDHEGRLNLAISDVGGAVLAVSQFTLYASLFKGNRPSFDGAAKPERARELYEYFVGQIRAAGLRCETGRFQEHMQVELLNDGPITILLDSIDSLDPRLRPITRSMFASFIERAVACKLEPDEWHTYALNHFSDEELEDARRQCVSCFTKDADVRILAKDDIDMLNSLAQKLHAADK